MENIKFSTTGKYTFLVSFGLGTVLFVLFLITKIEFLLLIGFMYVVFAIPVNIIVLLREILVFLSDISGEKPAGNSVLLLLLNIPIALLYFYILF